MLQFASNPAFFLLIFLLFSTSSALPSPFQFPLPVPEGVEIVDEINEVLPWKTWGSVLNKEDHTNNTTLVLAQRRTNRTDFFNHFQRYTGGWNITNDHYISSVISTAVPFFGFAVAWFVIFGLCLLLICLFYCCCHAEPWGYSKCAYALSLIFLILFTIAAIIGCAVLYTGQGNLHQSTSETLNYVVSQAEFTAENLKNVSDFFDTAKQVGVAIDLSFLPPTFGEEIDNVKMRTRNAAAVLYNKTEENSKGIHLGIEGMRLALIIVAAVMLFLAFAGFLFSILGLQCLVYFMVVFGWILVAGTIILCGAFLFLHKRPLEIEALHLIEDAREAVKITSCGEKKIYKNVIGDTCVAMDEWVQHPTAHTALDEILPCVENATALETLLRSRNVTHVLVDTVDAFISNVTNGDGNIPLFSYNQSGPPMPSLCNPFQTNLTPRNCAPGEVTLENATQVWMNYICVVSSGNCVTPGRMTPAIYTQIAAVVNVTYALYHYGPFLGDLVDCTFARKTFSDISRDYCPGLRIFTYWIYFGLVVVSVAVMLSLIFWMIYEREQRHRLYSGRMRYLDN